MGWARRGRAGVVAALLVVGALAAAGVAAPTGGRAQADGGCSPAQAGDFGPPAATLLDPAGRLRVFAMHHKQCLDDAVTYAGIEASLDAELRAHVDPWHAADRPDLVVFNELTGLIFGTEGSRGAAARTGRQWATFFDQLVGQEGAAGIGAVGAAYALPLAYYDSPSVFGPTDPSNIPQTVSRLFTALTDTYVRASVDIASRLARRHGVYLVMDAPLPVVEGTRCTGAYAGWTACPGWAPSTDPAATSLLVDPDLGAASSCPGVAQTPCVYVARTSDIDNVAMVFAPDGSLYDMQPKVSLTATERNPLGWHQASPATIHAIHLAGADATRDSDIRIGIGISLDAFEHAITGGDPCAQPRDSAGVYEFFMQCLDSKGVNLFLQPEFNSASESCMSWADFSEGGCSPGSWQPVGWMHSSWFAVQGRRPDGSFVHRNFEYAVNPFLVGNLFDVAGDGQSAIFARDDPRAHTGWYAGDSSATLYADPASGYVSHPDAASLSGFEGPRPGFLAVTPWTMPDSSARALYRTRAGQVTGTTDSLQACERGLGPGSGITSGPCAEDAYVPSVLVADLFTGGASSAGAGAAATRIGLPDTVAPGRGYALPMTAGTAVLIGGAVVVGRRRRRGGRAPQRR